MALSDQPEVQVYVCVCGKIDRVCVFKGSYLGLPHIAKNSFILHALAPADHLAKKTAQLALAH